MTNTTLLRNWSRPLIEAYFHKEASNFCPANSKLAWMNAYLRNGGTLPNKETIDNRLNIPAIVREDRAALMQNFSVSPSEVHRVAQTILQKTSPGIAIDLGGGNSSLAIALLQKNWQVIVVDPSEKALSRLCNRVCREGLLSIAEKNLYLVPEKMEDFVFPDKVDFIHAHASLPYCDAAKVLSVWDKIHSSLKVGGYFAGDVFNSCSYEKNSLAIDDNNPDPAKELVIRLGLGAWMASPSIMYSLLKHTPYKVDCFFMNTTTIDFVGVKK